MDTAESVSPLSIPPHPAPQPPPSTSSHSKSYVVLRNEISADPLEPAPIETAAVDFFSLDDDDDDVTEDIVDSNPVDSHPTPTEEVKENDESLEGTWFRSDTDCRFKSPMLQLHKEIVDFVSFLSPTPEEEASRNEAIQAVCGVIKFIWPYCKVEIFGSFKTGLYLPTSDIDAVILGSNITSPQHGLKALSKALSQKKIAEEIQVIGMARVPIIKFVEKKSGISFDVSFDMHNGQQAAEFIKSAISQWPPLRPLCLILKIFLKQRQLNEVFTGGIGSYALLVMIITALQTYCKSGNSSEHNLGVLLVNFFDLYGCRLNTSDVGISCVEEGEGTFFSKISRGFSPLGKRPHISILDPQSTEKDIGKGSHNYFLVQSSFATAFSILTDEKTITDLGSKRSILGTIIKPDATLLKRKGGSSGELTLKELLPGVGDGNLFAKTDAEISSWRKSRHIQTRRALLRRQRKRQARQNDEKKMPKEKKIRLKKARLII